MKKLTKLTTLLLALIMSLSMAFSFGCATTEQVIDDGKTINIKAYNAGYGTSYLYALAKQFEETYADEGYKVNIFTPRAGFSGEVMLQDIASGKGADIYFGGDFTESLITSDAYKDTVQDLTELVTNKKPINFNGEEEGDRTIAQIVEKAAESYPFTYYKKSDGTYYALPFNKGVRGLAVNTKVLADYNLEIPKTSDEFFHCYEVIMEKAAETGVFPITQISTNNNYAVSFTSGWLAQYEGKEWFNKFFSFQNDDGSKMTKEQAIEMFNADGIKYMLEGMYQALDYNTFTYGSETQGLEKAEAKLMTGECAFMMQIDCMLQETYANFTDKQRANLAFIAAPVISELGVKIFNAMPYNKSKDDCDKILRAVIDEVDENKTLEEIKAVIDTKFSMNVNTDDILLIAEARGYKYPECPGDSVIMSKQAKEKEICALFLRMFASTDGGKLVADKTLSTSPYVDEYETNRYEFVNSARKMMTNRYFWAKRPKSTGYRSTLHTNFADMLPYTGIYINMRIIQDRVTMYSSDGQFKQIANIDVYKEAANKLQTLVYEDARDNYNDSWR